jgi:hypothetical protein
MAVGANQPKITIRRGVDGVLWGCQPIAREATAQVTTIGFTKAPWSAIRETQLEAGDFAFQH